jgi:hypothetical protein
MSDTAEQEGFAWQTGIWDRMSDTYLREIVRFQQIARHFAPAPLVAGVRPGHQPARHPS